MAAYHEDRWKDRKYRCRRKIQRDYAYRIREILNSKTEEEIA